MDPSPPSFPPLPHSLPTTGQVKLQVSEAAAARELAEDGLVAGQTGGGGGGGGPVPVRGGDSRWSRHDSVIAQLLHGQQQLQQQQQQQHQRHLQQPHPRFFGRLCNVLSVPAPNAVVAVNAVLAELCHLPTTLVVADRTAAYDTLAAFRSARAGTVVCKVLSELQGQQQQQSQQQGHGYPQQQQQQHQLQQVVVLPGGVSGRLLEAAIVASSEGLGGLVHSLLGGWALVRDRSEAMQVLSAQRQQQGGNARGGGSGSGGGGGGGGQGRAWSLVTPSGEVFKADGEIVAKLRNQPAGGGRPPSEGPYDLGQVPKPMPDTQAAAAVQGDGGQQLGSFSASSSSAAATAASAGVALRERAEVRRRAAAEGLAALRDHVRSLEAAAEEAEAGLRQLARQQRQHQAAAAAAGREARAAEAKAAALGKEMAARGCPEAAAAVGTKGEAVESTAALGDGGDGGSGGSYIASLRVRVGELQAAVLAAVADQEGCTARCQRCRQALEQAMALSEPDATSAEGRLATAQRQMKEAMRLISKVCARVCCVQGALHGCPGGHTFRACAFALPGARSHCRTSTHTHADVYGA